MAPAAASEPATGMPATPPEQPVAVPVAGQSPLPEAAASSTASGDGALSPGGDGTPPADSAPASAPEAPVAAGSPAQEEPPGDLPPEMGRAAPPTVQLLTEVVEIAEEEEEDE
jgi:hypothetical protein